MGDKLHLKANRIKYVVLFSLNDLVKGIMDWGEQEGFIVAENIRKYSMGSTGATHEFNINAWRNVNPYIKLQFNVKSKIQHCKEVEITKEGKSVKRIHGHIMMIITAYVEIDWQNKFTGTTFKKVLGKLMNSFVYRHQIETYWDDFFYDLRNLEKVVRDTLQMQTGAQ